MSRTLIIVISILFTALAGCYGRQNVRPALDMLGSGSLIGQLRVFNGRTGRELTLAQAANLARRADVILFGEEHGDFVCNQVEAQLLAALAADRPTSLAMEFFETDTQLTLDAYLNGRISDTEFQKEARQRKPYSRAHRPLIEACRGLRLPVIAANAPRELVRRFRQSDEEYHTFLESLSPRERGLMPASFTLPFGAYYERFQAVMGDHAAPPATAPASAPASQAALASQTAPETQTAESTAIAESADSQPVSTQPVSPTTSDSPTAADSQPTDTQPAVTQPADAAPTDTQPAPTASADAPAEPATQAASAPASLHGSGGDMMLSMFKAQSLWDDSMAEAIANHRARYSDRRVMLVVGVFHVQYDGGTEMKLRQRRPRDRVVTIVYRGVEDLSKGFDPEDRGSGEFVIYGLKTE